MNASIIETERRGHEPVQKPGKSFQAYETPRDFLDAVERRFGSLAWDLACTAENAKAPSRITSEQDALAVDWSVHCARWLCWLNPEFGNIAPWAEKCAVESQRGCRILMLTPASVGSNWFQQWVVPYAHVLELSPRLSFDGKNPFPKDLILSVYMHGLTGRSHWRWK
ncbi:MAG TPA: DNA N-6-adenine-methyltransferase [Polyangiaceae bacterium]|nr:DNA N-6-adenine-methyltransferase [Polyangiaceae bacterium]